jgi:hypothetical protein
VRSPQSATTRTGAGAALGYLEWGHAEILNRQVWRAGANLVERCFLYLPDPLAREIHHGTNVKQGHSVRVHGRNLERTVAIVRVEPFQDLVLRGWPVDPADR